MISSHMYFSYKWRLSNLMFGRGCNANVRARLLVRLVVHEMPSNAFLGARVLHGLVKLHQQSPQRFREDSDNCLWFACDIVIGSGYMHGWTSRLNWLWALRWLSPNQRGDNWT